LNETDSIEARLRRVEDLAAIHQLFIDYGAHLDTQDFDAYASLFAEDAEILLGPIGRAKGRENIKALMEKTTGRNAGASFHLIGNPQVSLDGDRASSRVAWAVVAGNESGQPYLSLFGHHKDQLIRQDGRWYFLRRAGYVDIPAAMPPR
jgi:ketosteroid isomerase-like protein